MKQRIFSPGTDIVGEGASSQLYEATSCNSVIAALEARELERSERDIVEMIWGGMAQFFDCCDVCFAVQVRKPNIKSVSRGEL